MSNANDATPTPSGEAKPWKPIQCKDCQRVLSAYELKHGHGCPADAPQPLPSEPNELSAQVRFADQIIGTLVADAYHDTSTDLTGFTISKRQLGKLAGEVMKKVKRGDFMTIPESKRVKF